MTRPVEGEAPPKSGILKLRLNLTIPTAKGTVNSNGRRLQEKEAEVSEEITEMDTVESGPETPTTLTRSPRKVFAQDRRSPRKRSITVQDENVSLEQPNSTAPMKLTVRLKGPPPSVGADEGKRKIILSVKNKVPAEEKSSESIDVEAVDRPSKRPRSTVAPKVKKVSNDEMEGSNSKGPRVRKNLSSKETTTPHPFASIPVVNKSSSSNAPGSTKMPIPSYRPMNMTRVPIAALTSLTTMTPGEREEERILRQCISETFSTLWPMVTKPDPSKIFENWDDLQSALLPYWLMLAPIDSAFNVPTLKSPNHNGNAETDHEDRVNRVNEDFTKLKSRFEQFSTKERNKSIATELLVLEQRLCLEEEKFLYAKLKSEYNKKVGELVARKRQTAESGTLQQGNPQQRILPKSWR